MVTSATTNRSRYAGLRYSGSASIWGFALYLYSSGKYEDQILPTGGFAGSPEDALDCACNLYLS